MDPFDLTGSEIAGFRLTRRLGSGGMASVYRAENVLQPSIVRALKIVHPTLAVEPEFLRRFAEEARNTERLTHPNVVRFHGLREEAGRYIIELELLSGCTLAEMMSRLGAREVLPVAEVVDWMRQSALGVAAAHAIGVVHRDLKPENLFLTEDGVVKVLDFGIARARDEAERITRATQAGTAAGTAGYLAPEGWETGTVGPPADVYSLGLTLAELLLGHHPFMRPGEPRPSRVQLMNAHINKGIPQLRQLRGDVPDWLLDVVTRATLPDPDQRYPTAAELADALEEGARGVLGGADAAPTAIANPDRSISMTQVALPTYGARAARAPDVPKVSPGPKALRMWPVVALAGGSGLAVLAAAIGWVAMHPSGGAAPAPEQNRWIELSVPERPVSLGMSSTDGVGFGPEAGVHSPTVGFALQQHEVTWGEMDPWLVLNAGASFGVPPNVPPDAAARSSFAASGVPWLTADAYCRSLGVNVALPTEEQWEFAARGEALRPFSWGDRAPDPLRTNALATADWAVKPVMSSPQDRTPGSEETTIYDMMGNVREWTADPFRVSASGITPPQAASATQTMRTIRGLPLKPRPGGDRVALPRIGAAWRMPLCGSGTCLTQPTLSGESVPEALQEVGFRCALDGAASNPGGG